MDTMQDKKKRRSKKDSDGRSFSCECGKSYLSYQALYTHKRTKHGDTSQSEDTPKKKRGRPKGLKSDQNEYDPCSALGDSPLASILEQRRVCNCNSTCDEILAEYLNEKSKKIGKKEYKAVATSVLGLRECINKYYKEIEEKCEIEEGQEYSKQRSATLLPKISNSYILKYLPEIKEGYDKEAEVDFMLGFCSWLIEKNYTELEVAVLN